MAPLCKKKNKIERLEKIKYSNPQLIVREWTVKNVTVKMPYNLGSFNWWGYCKTPPLI
jgi:hypothetical protein